MFGRLRTALRGALVAAMVLVGWPVVVSAAPWLLARQAVTSYSGTLLYLHRGDIWQLDLLTQQGRLLLDPGPGIVSHVAHSLDGQRLAYSVIYAGSSFQILGSDIFVANADGSAPQLVAHEEGAEVTLTSPTWSADGRRLVYAASDMRQGTDRLEEVELATGARMAIVETGSSPSLSRDGQWLAYTYWAERGWSIWNLHRPSGFHWQLVSETWFRDADSPSFSPDGASVAFAAVGDGPRQASALMGTLTAAVRRSLVASAHAHDLDQPFDLWVVRPDGNGLRRVAKLQNVQPSLAWSPDGRHLAAWGWQGLQVVDMATGALTWLPTPPGSGPISWGL